MKFSYKIIILVIVVALVGWFVYPKKQTAPVQNTSDFLQYSSTTYGISFSYPSNYVLSERDRVTSDLRKHHNITLMNKNDLPLPVDGEGPPLITINIYANDTSNYTAETWARSSAESNLAGGSGNIATTTVAGFPAISFRWSGLYDGTTIVLAKTDSVYTFDVTYLEMGAQIVQDFVVVRDSVKFVK